MHHFGALACLLAFPGKEERERSGSRWGNNGERRRRRRERHKVSKSILHTRSKDVNRAFPGYKMGACKKFDVSVYLLVELVLSSTASWTSVSCSSLLLFHCDLRAAAGEPGYIMDATANPKRIIPALMAVESLLRLNLDIVGLVPAGEGNKATDDDVDAMALSRFPTDDTAVTKSTV